MISLFLLNALAGPEATTYTCDLSCLSSAFARRGETVWFEEALPLHPDEFDDSGIGVQPYTRIVDIPNRPITLEQDPGCRRTAIEALGPVRLARTVQQRDASGACVPVDSMFRRSVTIPEGTPKSILLAMTGQLGLTLRTQTALPWEVDFAGATTLAEACNAVAQQAQREGSSLLFGISHNQLVVFRAPPTTPPTVTVEEALRQNAEAIRQTDAEAAKARQAQ